MSGEKEDEESTWATPRDKTSNLHVVVPPNAVVEESCGKDDKSKDQEDKSGRSILTVACEEKSEDMKDEMLYKKSSKSSAVKTVPRVQTIDLNKQPTSPRSPRQISVSQDGGVTFKETEDEAMATDADALRDDRFARLRLIIESTWWNCLGAFALGVALFGGGLFIMFDIPDNPGVGLQDFFMVAATMFFIAEMIVLSLGEREYLLGAFFFMDVVGTVSMIFEISFLLGRAGKTIEMSDAPNTVVMKVARAAKVGARIARLSKVAKCFSFVMRRRQEKDQSMPEYDATVLKTRLTQALATRVSILTVVLIIGVPLFDIGRYPMDDFSIRGWSRTLEMTYSLAYSSLVSNQNINTTDIFRMSVQEMVEFYDDLDYYPFDVDGYPREVSIGASRVCTIPGEGLLSDEKPNRKQNILQQNVDVCRDPVSPRCSDGMPSIYFNLNSPNQYEAGMDIALTLFVVIAMVVSAFNLNYTIDMIMVKPVERMLGTVQMMAQILNTVQEKGGFDVINEDECAEGHSLELVFQRLSNLTVQFMKASEVSETEMNAMDNESKGIILEVLQLNKQPDQQLWAVHKATSDHQVVVHALPVEEEVIESWELETMKMSADDLRKVMMFIFYDSKLGRRTGRIWADPTKFHAFHEVIRAGYLDVPYHTYTHAADVVTCVFRVMLDLHCEEWLSEIDMYALLVSALAHDIGHPGRTTPFLVETRHELAVRYNDASPLENMHCARLFEICSHDVTNIFGRLEKDAFKQARKVCITAILHTDNAQHFEMVKSVKKMYDMYMDICDAQTAAPDILSDEYREEVLHKDTPLWHKLILHLCDVSTPLKPFHISRPWATRVQDEFFNQGDEEKNLGIPVGMLNDRDKVSRTGAEHGFINFLVAPLVFPTIGVFPQLHHLAVQMCTNMQEWRNLWVQDVKPPPDDVKKRDGEVSKVQETVEKMARRKAIPTVRTSQKLGSVLENGNAQPIPRGEASQKFGPTLSLLSGSGINRQLSPNPGGTGRRADRKMTS